MDSVSSLSSISSSDERNLPELNTNGLNNEQKDMTVQEYMNDESGGEDTGSTYPICLNKPFDEEAFMRRRRRPSIVIRMKQI